MLPELRALLDIQELDLRIARLDRRLARAPEDLAGIDREIEAARSSVTRVEERLRRNERDGRRAEGQLADAEAAVEKYGDQLMQARTNDEYRALRTQIHATRERIRGIEDRILELMEAQEELEAKVAVRRREFASARSRLEEKKEGVRAEVRQCRSARERLGTRRSERAAQLPREIRDRYERIRGIRGQALARAADELCGACHVALRPQVFEEVRADKGILACESCSRLLYFDPPAPDPEGVPA